MVEHVLAQERELEVCSEVPQRGIRDLVQNFVQSSLEFDCQEAEQEEQLEPHHVLREPEDADRVAETLVEGPHADQEDHGEDDQDVQDGEGDVPAVLGGGRQVRVHRHRIVLRLTVGVRHLQQSAVTGCWRKSAWSSLDESLEGIS